MKLSDHFYLNEDDKLISLYHTSLAVVSTLDLVEILNRVVDCTRVLTGAEKAVLVLTKPTAAGLALDLETMVVRGKRTEHPEKWWRGEIERMAKNVVHRGAPVLVSNKKRGNGSSLVCVPVSSKGRNIAILSAINSFRRGFQEEDILILTILASHAASAIDNARLYERAKRLAAASEKARIAREMHDSTAQALFGIIVNLESCFRMLPSNPQGARAKIKKLQSMATKSLTELREDILSFKSEADEDIELSAKLKNQINEFNDLSSASVDFKVIGEERPLPEDMEGSFCRILGEALSNVLKHARASEISVELRFTPKKTCLTVKDNGKGFDVQKTLVKVGRRGEMGLTNMYERTEALGGFLGIESVPRKGTKLKVSLPG